MFEFDTGNNVIFRYIVTDYYFKICKLHPPTNRWYNLTLLKCTNPLNNLCNTTVNFVTLINLVVNTPNDDFLISDIQNGKKTKLDYSRWKNECFILLVTMANKTLKKHRIVLSKEKYTKRCTRKLFRLFAQKHVHTIVHFRANQKMLFYIYLIQCK